MLSAVRCRSGGISLGICVVETGCGGTGGPACIIRTAACTTTTENCVSWTEICLIPIAARITTAMKYIIRSASCITTTSE